jgi:prepilin-type N-terminal cleavage/methylation domain-containing protein
VTRSCHKRRAFTLLELLVSIGIIAALVGSMFGYLLNIQSSRDRLLERGKTSHAMTVLIDRLESRLATALVGDSKFGSGLKGDAVSIAILSRGVLASGGVDTPSLAAILADLQRTEVRFDERGRSVQVRESPVGTESADGELETMDAIVHRLRFRYHDGREWVDEFDSMQAGRLPTAVEVAIWLRPLPGEPVEAPEETDEESDGNEIDAEFESTFDEREFLDSVDALRRGVPKPDRLRIIFIPDAGGESIIEAPLPAEDDA